VSALVIAVPYTGPRVGCSYCSYAVRDREHSTVLPASVLVGEGRHARELCEAHASAAIEGWRP